MTERRRGLHPTMSAARHPLLQLRRFEPGYQRLPVFPLTSTPHIEIPTDGIPHLTAADETPRVEGVLHQRAREERVRAEPREGAGALNG